MEAREGSEAALREDLFGILKQHFRPELLNRIDETLVFRALGEEEIRRIVDLEIAALQSRLEGRDVHLRVTDEARRALGEIGYDPDYGARPLKRVIQREVQNPLAMKLLSGEIGAGQVLILDRAEDGSWVWTVQEESDATGSERTETGGSERA